MHRDSRSRGKRGICVHSGAPERIFSFYVVFSTVFIFIICFTSLQAHANGTEVTGRVTSSKEAPLKNVEDTVASCRIGEMPKSELLPEGGPLPFACGPASMAIAFEILGLEIVNEELAALADEDQSSNFADLAAYARSKGLYVEVVRMGLEHLCSLHNVAILQINSLIAETATGEPTPHFVVFAGPVNEEIVYAFDPRAASGMRGPFLLSELAEMWTGRALILSKYPIDLSRLGVGTNSSRFFSFRQSFVLLVLIGLCAMIISTIGVIVHKRRTANNSTVISLVLIACACPGFGVGGSVSAEVMPRVKTASRSKQLSKKPIESRYVAEIIPYSAGVVSKGTTIKHKFEIFNPDKKNIDIRLGKSSCLCLDAKIIGPKSIAPGQKSKVAVTIYTGKGGKMQHGVLLHVSNQKEPVPLLISANVKNDTIISPKALDFGNVRRGNPLQLRPLKILHYGTKEHIFQIKAIVSSVPFLTVASQDKPNEVSVGDGVIMYEHRLQIALGPNACQVGQFAEKLTINAMIGKVALQFHLPCSGSILPVVAARPNRIIRMQETLPKELDVEVDLEATKKTYVIVKSIESEGINLIGWSQKRNSKTNSTLLSLRIQPLLEKGRAMGTCRVKLAEPAGEVVNIPVRLIELRKPQGDKQKD